MVKREVGLDTYQGCSFGLSLGTDDNTFLLFQSLVHYPFGPFGLIARTRTNTRMSRVGIQALSPVCVAHVACPWSSTRIAQAHHTAMRARLQERKLVASLKTWIARVALQTVPPVAPLALPPRTLYGCMHLHPYVRV